MLASSGEKEKLATFDSLEISLILPLQRRKKTPTFPSEVSSLNRKERQKATSSRGVSVLVGLFLSMNSEVGCQKKESWHLSLEFPVKVISEERQEKATTHFWLNNYLGLRSFHSP